jgi:hypothetical protein
VTYIGVVGSRGWGDREPAAIARIRTFMYDEFPADGVLVSALSKDDLLYVKAFK